MSFSIPREKNMGGGIRPGDTIDLLGSIGFYKGYAFSADQVSHQ